MGGGVPVGAFMSSAEIMKSLQHSPKLGHITTFGGNPLIAAASYATLKEVLDSGLMNEVDEKEKLFRELLVHPKIKKVNGRGLMLAVELESPEYTLDVAKRCMEKGKLFSFEHYDRVPDILVMGKGMGGGVPVGAFMSSAEIMKSLQHSPKLGHITTFGGNPLIAAASYETLKEVLDSGLMNEVEEK